MSTSIYASISFLTKCVKGLAKTVQGWQISCCVCVKVAQREHRLDWMLKHS